MDADLVKIIESKYKSAIKSDAKALLKAVIKDYMKGKGTDQEKSIDWPAELKTIEDLIANVVKTSFAEINHEAYLAGITAYSGWIKPEDDTLSVVSQIS